MLFFMLHSYTICWAGEGSKLSYCTASDSVRAVEGAIPEKNAALDSVSANPVYDTAVNCVPDLM